MRDLYLLQRQGEVEPTDGVRAVLRFVDGCSLFAIEVPDDATYITNSEGEWFEAQETEINAIFWRVKRVDVSPGDYINVIKFDKGFEARLGIKAVSYVGDDTYIVQSVMPMGEAHEVVAVLEYAWIGAGGQ